MRLIDEISEWKHLFEFEDMIGNSSDDDWLSYRNFRKTVYIDFCHILQFESSKWIEEE